PPRSTLFPYTTLFRSSKHATASDASPSRTRTRALLAHPCSRVGSASINLSVSRSSSTSVLGATGAGGTVGTPSVAAFCHRVRKRSEEHTSELQSRSDL